MLEPESKYLLDRLGVSEETIADFCLRHRITEFSLFGSALRDDFRADSDVDIIVDFEAGATPSLNGHIRMQIELESILGRDVDLFTARSVRDMRNRFRRERIQHEQQQVYGRV